MIIGPKKTKYKKVKKGKLGRFEFKTNTLKFGLIGLKAIESGMITLKQIEASRQAITRKIKKKGKLWIRIFPNIPISSKSIGVRMGKGKGTFSCWGTKVKKGTVLFEICSSKTDIIYSALKTGGAKLPVKTQIFT